MLPDGKLAGRFRAIPRLAIAAWVLCPLQCLATTYYVSPVGSDQNSGSRASPFRSLQRAEDVTEPGDTVIVADGIYGAPPFESIAGAQRHHNHFHSCGMCHSDGEDYGPASLQIWRSGKPGAWITFEAAPGAFPIVAAFGAGSSVSIKIDGASYVRIDGIRTLGSVKATPMMGKLPEHIAITD